ncbi:MAG: CRISPR-associated helicase Cas3' [Deltaproteobacteria bacterium]|nr:CRISPR-associated helicase Cas3' [Deltaproteobacteria bacterium]
MDKHCYYAHSIDGQPSEHWQSLEEHLHNVSEMAESFGDTFDAGRWAYLAGLWHDLGKYSQEFQAYLKAVTCDDAQEAGKITRVDHSTAGAQLANGVLKGGAGKLLAYIVAGHHGGLPDGKNPESTSLSSRLEKSVPDYSAAPDFLKDISKSLDLPFIPVPERGGFQLSFFTRMIYSCLVDADFLDTEKFMDPTFHGLRSGYPSLEELHAKLDIRLRELAKNAAPTPINGYRRTILENCIKAAEQSAGLFSLTVPTGGGKTLSSMAFAMRNALTHGMRRIIYVIPFTSIIEQNADVFRRAMGDEAVLEHHSNFEPEREDMRSRLASENWDAPIVVTTNVQFFESFFHNRSSRCRKLHNVAGSVVILDEAQMLPTDYLKPCLEVLRELTSSYGTTVVLCTATQPALSVREDFKEGLEGIREIMPDPGELYAAFRRVRASNLGKITNDDLARRLSSHRQALCIVNTRKHARKLYEKLQDTEGALHLSGFMCPEHRREVIRKLREDLAGGRPCRVISTQLIEAGVDVDFPVVYRAAAGIDSVAQAAGRCNREGRMDQGGEVFIFTPEEKLPAGHFRQTADLGAMVLRRFPDPLSPEALEAYFRALYWEKGEDLDKEGILADLSEGTRRGDFPFSRVSQKFRIIKEDQESVIIPWNRDAE